MMNLLISGMVTVSNTFARIILNMANYHLSNKLDLF